MFRIHPKVSLQKNIDFRFHLDLIFVSMREKNTFGILFSKVIWDLNQLLFYIDTKITIKRNPNLYFLRIDTNKLYPIKWTPQMPV